MKSRSLELSDSMVTNGMHAAMAMQTIFGSADAIRFFFREDYIMSGINAARVVFGLCFWAYGLAKKRHDIGFLGLLVVAWVGMAAQTAYHGGLLSSYLFWVTIFGPICVLVGSRKLGFAISFASIVWFLVLGYLGANGYIKEVSSKPSLMAYSTIVCMIIFLAMCYVVTNYQQSLLVTLDQEFERANAIEVNKNRFLTHVNHELRTPLSALLLSVDLLRDSKHEESKDEILRSIDITANHILSILNGVLDSEREDHFNANEPVTEFDPLEVARESIDILSAKAASCGVTLKVEPEAGIERPRIGNRVNLRQVLINLISNSIQHGGGKTTVSVKRSGEALTYEIHDDGQGMSPKALENLFKPYSASMGATGTTGLGLSICKNLVEIKMGGQIFVSSNRTGTRFTVTVPFPIVTKSPQSKPPRRFISSGDDPTYIPLHGKSILVVEDDAFNNEKVTKLLENAKMRPVSVSDSNEALEKVKTHGPFVFALVDNDLGVASPLNGVGLTKLIGGQTKVIGYTGNHSSALDRTWRAAGASSVIRKPVQINGILTALLQALPRTELS